MDNDTGMLISVLLAGLLIGGLSGFWFGGLTATVTVLKPTIVNPPPLNVTVQYPNQFDSNAISNTSMNFPFNPIYSAPSKVPEGITDCTQSPIVVTSSVINIVIPATPVDQPIDVYCAPETPAEQYTFISATPLHSGIDTFAIHIVLTDTGNVPITYYMTIIIPTPVPVQHLTVNIYIENIDVFYNEILSTSVTVSGT